LEKHQGRKGSLSATCDLRSGGWDKGVILA
jgi:hypothetical protein